jgi:hypothetical protein
MNLSIDRGGTTGAERRWQLGVAALASLALSLPLILKGTPDVESYVLSIFSTMAFANNLAAGVDPWFTPAYGFGIPLPTSSWLIKFPLAIPAALAGVDWLYAVIWLGGEFVFAFYFLRLAMVLTGRRVVAVVLLVSALLSFSNLGTTYVDDWPEAFLGWAFFPACLWFVARTLVSTSTRERLKAAAACAFTLGVFTGITHHNEMVTFFSGLGVMMAFLLRRRTRAVLTVAGAIVVALCSSADVLVPTALGMLAAGANPLAGSIAAVPDAPTPGSYGIFLEPARAYAAGGLTGIAESTYGRVPFFGLTALVLAIVGAARPFASRAAIGAVPNDLARALAVGFVVYSALTLLPSWVVLNLPRMWTYRDGQTVLGLLCAGMAIDGLWHRFGQLLRPALALQLVQMSLVAAPIIHAVVSEDNDARLFGYAREERVLFDGLRRAGVDSDSRLMVAGELEDLLRGSLSGAGVTASTDFALEGIPLINAWYRGAMTPELGEASMNGRYGSYESIISWKKNLRYLERSGVDVLGITDVAVLEQDLDALRFANDLTQVGTFDLPGNRRVRVLHNDDAWSRATLLVPGTIGAPPRPSCPSPTIFCGDYTDLSSRLQARLNVDWQGSSMRAMLPSGHAGGTVLVSVAAWPRPVALVDGERRDVDFVLGRFAAFTVRPGERTIVVSVRKTGRIALSLIGLSLLLGSLAVAIAPTGRSASAPRTGGERRDPRRSSTEPANSCS